MSRIYSKTTIIPVFLRIIKPVKIEIITKLMKCKMKMKKMEKMEKMKMPSATFILGNRRLRRIGRAKLK